MKNHTHSHSHNKPAVFEPAHPERFAAAQKSTWISIWINLLLTVLQVVGGIFGKSQALIADGLHSLSDLLADIMVLFANRHGNRHADANHPYGHARIETAATLILGVTLAVLGVLLLVAAGMRLQNPQNIQAVHPMTLWIALFTLFAKEGLFRYMLAVAKRVRSQMLVANAWHARSDAASSLVVVIGIGGNLLGYTFLDLVRMPLRRVLPFSGQMHFCRMKSVSRSALISRSAQQAMVAFALCVTGGSWSPVY